MSMKNEISEFVDSVIYDLAKREGVPFIFHEFGFFIGVAVYDPKRTIIILREHRVFNAWRKNKETAKRNLRYVLAHEFYHYLVHIKKRYATSREEQRDADRYATTYASFSQEEVKLIKSGELI